MRSARQLHIQFFLAILAALGVFLIAHTFLWNVFGTSRGELWSMEIAAQLAESLLPPNAAHSGEQQRIMEDLRERLHMDLALYDPQGALLATAGNIPPLKPARLLRKGWAFVRNGAVWILPLHDGRRLVMQPRHLTHVSGMRLFMIPLCLGIALALGAYPIARRLTRRLERLQAGVERLGAGDLSARVPVEGQDELAALARSFNASAERIETLVKSHQLLLANCSHELRTPLARIRLGLERLSGESSQALREELARSIAELDTLIGEMLLASRLDTLRQIEHPEEVDLLALAAEESAYFDRTVEGTPVTVSGDASLLRRMLRNLLDNAQRHAGGATRVEVASNAAGNAELIVEDRGAGVADAEQEKIFEPFYRAQRTTAEVKGFGLGLALVRQIARAHGGEVRYTRLADGGSRFTVNLPAHRAPPRLEPLPTKPVK